MRCSSFWFVLAALAACEPRAPHPAETAATATASAPSPPPISTPSAASPAPPIATDEALDFRGTIGPSRVVVRLIRSGDALSGSYFYEPKATDLALKGSVAGANVSLEEKSGDRVTGSFALAFDASRSLGGTWSDPARHRRLDVKLERVAYDGSSVVLVRREIRVKKRGHDYGHPDTLVDCTGTLAHPEALGLPLAVGRFVNGELAGTGPRDIPEDDCAGDADYSVQLNARGLLGVSLSYIDSGRPKGNLDNKSFLLDDQKVLAFEDIISAKEDRIEKLVAARVRERAGDDTDIVKGCYLGQDFQLAPGGLRLIGWDCLPPALQAYDVDPSGKAAGIFLGCPELRPLLRAGALSAARLCPPN